jgi:hypothetical protein
MNDSIINMNILFKRLDDFGGLQGIRRSRIRIGQGLRSYTLFREDRSSNLWNLFVKAVINRNIGGFNGNRGFY